MCICKLMKLNVITYFTVSVLWLKLILLTPVALFFICLANELVVSYDDLWCRFRCCDCVVKYQSIEDASLEPLLSSSADVDGSLCALMLVNNNKLTMLLQSATSSRDALLFLLRSVVISWSDFILRPLLSCGWVPSLYKVDFIIKNFNRLCNKKQKPLSSHVAYRVALFSISFHLS